MAKLLPGTTCDSSRPRVLDLFCGAGGASSGYFRAGFNVVGVDIKPQPHYPFKFYQADAFDFVSWHGADFDVIHASPPCQFYCRIIREQYRNNHPDLISAVRDVLRATGKPFVIENVIEARPLLHNPIMLCGSMFGLRVFRHRLFELSPERFILLPSCNHHFQPVLLTGSSLRYRRLFGRGEALAADKRAACGIDWMTVSELDSSIPPAYTAFLGSVLLSFLTK